MKAIEEERFEAIRHLKKCLERLRELRAAIETQQQWPDQVFFEKLSWPEESVIFSKELPDFLDYSILPIVYLLRKRLMNYNYDTKAAKRTLDRNKKSELLRSIEYVEGVADRLVRYLPLALTDDYASDVPKARGYPDILTHIRKD